MKLYNPFKPHIAFNSEGYFLIREYDFFHSEWRYLDTKPTTDRLVPFWWTGGSNYYKDCKIGSIEEARIRLAKLNKKPIKETFYEN